MKNYLKKIGALLMAVIMVVTMCVTAFAADSETGTGTDQPAQPTVKTATGTGSDRGVITAEGIKKESGITVYAYQIVKADYDETNGNFTGYSNVYKKSDGSDYISTITSADPATLSALAQVVKSDSMVPDSRYPMKADATGEVYTATVPVGSYLVLVEGAEAVSYNVAVVSVFYTNQAGTTIISEGKVNYLSEGNTWVKRNDKPELTKKIVESDSEKDHNSANIGDTVNYKMTIDPVPDYRGKYPRLDVVDTLSKGLTYKDGSLKVYLAGTGDDGKETKTELTEGTAYVKTIGNYDANNGTTITVDFVKHEAGKDDQYLLTSYAGRKIIIEYSAVLNENAELNEHGNKNSATLNYSKDSNTNNADGSDIKNTYTYTFDIKGSTEGNTSLTDKLIVKTGEDEWTKEDGDQHITDKKPLAGAEFTLYTDADCTKVYSNKKTDGTTYFNGVTTSDATGQLNIYGLSFGTYYLKETKAPGDYTLNSHVFKIEIAAGEWNYDNTLKSWTITIDGKTTNTFVATSKTVEINGTTTKVINPTEIKNTKTAELPSTGGMGTYLFTITGVMIMAAVAGMFFVSRRRDRENQL